jgi:hypothetical protein
MNSVLNKVEFMAEGGGGGGAGGVGGLGGASALSGAGNIQAGIADFDKAFVSALENAFTTSKKEGGGSPMIGEAQAPQMDMSAMRMS